MNITIKTNCTHHIVTCHKCHRAVAERGSLFCPDCNRALFPQDYEGQAERCDADVLQVEVIDHEERDALRSDSQRDSR